MNWLPIIYFAYMFVSFYFLIFNLILYFKNKNTLFDVPLKTKEYSISVIIPAYNEEDTIATTVKSVFEVDYGNILEVLVVNDGSKDNTLEVLKNLLAKYRGQKTKLVVINKKNSGKADSINTALKFAKGELVVVIDADSYPARDSFSKLVGFFDEPATGAAAVPTLPRNRFTFLEKLQDIEYRVIAFTRKLLGYVDSIYVVPGPLAMYRKKALDEIGGFDTKNLTEDIEITWRLIHNGWKIRMCLCSEVLTTVPNKIRPWFLQRRRWAVGGIQCLNKYKKCFLKKGMLGYFIIPFFALGLVLGLVGMAIFSYVISRKFIANYLLAKYSMEIGVPVLTMNQLLITPNVLNYFGAVLFGLFLLFNLFVLAVIKDNLFKKQSFFNILFYMTIYLLVYPIVLVVAVVHMLKGKREWGN